MKKEIETLTAVYIISKQEFEMIRSSSELEQIIKGNLVEELANYILKNLEKIPVEFASADEGWQQKYEIKMNLISNEALKELMKSKQQLEHYVYGTMTDYSRGLRNE